MTNTHTRRMAAKDKNMNIWKKKIDIQRDCWLNANVLYVYIYIVVYVYVYVYIYI